MASSLLPPLYFQEKQGLLFTATSSDGTNGNDGIGLAPELLHHCCDFLGWGDLAKLACIQRAWKDSLYDAAAASDDALWSLACAYLHGTDGLHAHPTQAFKLLHRLVHVNVDAATGAPVYGSNNHSDVESSNNNTTNVSEYVAIAAMKLAFLYLETTVALPKVGDQSTITSTDMTTTTTSVSTQTGMTWLECAFDLGHCTDAAHELALIYEYGKFGCATDVVAAAAWFHRAADAGHVDAMAELGLCYELGCGVVASDTDALDWYIQAAQAGHVTASFAVGEIFEEARGVPQSDEEACVWYYQAAVEGDVDSRRALRRLQAIARIVVPGARALLDE